MIRGWVPEEAACQISGTLHVIKRTLAFVLSDKGSQWEILSKHMYLKDVFKRYHFVSSFQNNLQGSKDSITKTTQEVFAIIQATWTMMVAVKVMT